MRFGLLGSLEVRADGGEAIELGGAQPRTVLTALLAAEGRVVPAEALIDAVWGEGPPDSAAATLQTYVSRLRRALEPDRGPRDPAKVLVSDPAGYRLVVPADAVDFRRFEQLAHEGSSALERGRPDLALDALDAAEALWRGRALVELPDAEFARGLAVRLEEGRMVVLEHRLEAELALGRAATVVARAAEAVGTWPLREHLRALLALALYRSGRQSEALRALDDARTTLVEELGVEPSRELRDLEAAILAHDPALDVTVPTSVPVPPAVAVPAPTVTGSALVGRRVELAQLRQALDESSRAARFAIVEGEPGIGKTRLLEAFAEEAETGGALVVWGRTHEGGAAPAFWPWLEALRSLVRTHPDAAVGIEQLIDPIATEVAGPAGTSSFRLFEAVAAALGSVAAAHHLVVLLDDLQWADLDSLELLTFLAGRLRDEHVLVVGTIRDSEVRASDEVVEVLAAVARRPSTRRVALRGLPSADVAQLLAQTTGQVVSPSVAEAISERTEGNPFFAGELARLLVDEAALDDAGASTVRRSIPAGVRDVVRQRLGRLPAATVELLGLGAVLGRNIELDLLGQAADRPLGDVLDDLEPALGARLLVEAPGTAGGLRFSHALVRESLVDELSSLRRARLHLRAAEAVAARSGQADDVAEIVAEHLWAAVPLGVGVRAAEALERAGDVAVRRGAYESAARVFERAVSLHRASRDTAAELRCLARLLGVQRVIGDYVGVPSSYGRATDLARRAGRDDLLVELLWGEWSVHSITGGFARGRALVDQLVAVSEGSDDPALRMAGRAAAGIQCWDEGRISEMRVHLVEADALVAGLPPDSEGMTLLGYQRLLAQTFYAHALGLAGEQEACDERFTALSAPHIDAYQRTTVDCFWATTLLAVGRLDGVEQLARRGLAADPDGVYSFWAANLTIQLGVGLLHRGELERGRERVDAGLAQYAGLGIRTGLACFLASAGLALLGQGCVDDAVEYVGRARTELDTFGQRWPEPVVLLAEAELLASTGAPADEVAARFDQAAAVARSQGSSAAAERIAAATTRWRDGAGS